MHDGQALVAQYPGNLPVGGLGGWPGLSSPQTGCATRKAWPGAGIGQDQLYRFMLPNRALVQASGLRTVSTAAWESGLPEHRPRTRNPCSPKSGDCQA